MAHLPLTLADPRLAARLDACLDVEDKIPRALEALGPVAERDVLLVDGAGGRWEDRLGRLGGRIRTVDRPSATGRLDVPDGAVDVVLGLWSTFRGASPTEVAEADRALRPGGRLLVVHDYGRDDVAGLRGDLPEYGSWSRPNGPYLMAGFKIRVIHCFWTFGSLEDTRAFLGDAFGTAGTAVGATLRRPRLTYNVAVYHRSRAGSGPGS